jgi:hypothetical protein
MRTVGDAKGAIALEYPKLFARFNQAFHAFSDDTELDVAIPQIVADVEGWLASMPDNFKSTHHALSRPKFGALYVLKNEDVRARMGTEACDEAIHAIESQWDACKRKLVVAAPPALAVSAADAHEDAAEVAEVQQDVNARNARLVDTLSQGIRQLLQRHYDDTVVELFDGLLRINGTGC